MIYLYAGLGIAMLTGIMAIFEMGVSLTGSSLLSSRLMLIFDIEIKEMDQGCFLF